MTLIHTPASAPAVYPYGLARLRADNPNVSFSANPTAEDLAPFAVFPVAPSDPPACDPRTERLEEADPAQSEDGTWQQQWRIREATSEELAAYDAMNQPRPDWPTFKAAALRNPALNAAVVAADATAPLAARAITAALLKAEAGDPADFRGCWRAVCAAATVPPELITELVELAQQCHLPQAFVEALEPERQRARDEAGRFIADDPATPENEAWVAAP